MAHFKTNDNTVEKILFQEEVGTYSPDTGNIYYQSKITDLFKPITNDIKNFKDKIEKLFRGNLNNKSMIQKIRDSIKNGTIIKEMNPDGTYIWRKIRK
jgi:hypothetical protein